MAEKDSAVAIIPARGGSKRIPRKNLSLVQGKPLLSWVISTALSTHLFHRVIVSSEDSETLSVAVRYGAEAYRRPTILSDDLTHVGPVVEDCLRGLGAEPTSTCLIYATAILLRPEHLKQAASLLQDPSVGSVLAIAEYESPIQRAYEIRDDGTIAMVNPEFFESRSQDLPLRYRDTGLFSWWKNDRAGKRMGLVVPKSCAVDIDTLEDLEVAEALFIHHRRPVQVCNQKDPA